ncbi:zf-PARP-domain-containing protein [Plenodomus tracheiphilus IPT5]|uniref:Zf-PARP-domain-containing protein n=1 Tax=Plenodomus tracheiphilus IPT5 TaxID=1408161 RepID=A0A6A7AU13_9PLEO|nr:zf-PARP-domain-containing protein [Plenodomus tracheiphilus IPT5]
MSGDADGPKWRLEHSSNNRSVCNQAACKRAQVKIAKGELRIGTNTLYDRDEEQRWYIAWRHWACATKQQILGLKELTSDDPTKASGFGSLSPESQEQVRLAFEAGRPADKEFKDIREDLATVAPSYVREYTDAQGYKADVSTRAAACRGTACSQKGAKVVKGELRLGILVDYDGDHANWYYKHWQCMSTYDLAQAKQCFEDDGNENTFAGIDALPVEYKQVVIDTLKIGKVIKPPELEPAEPPKSKKARDGRPKTPNATQPTVKNKDEDEDEDKGNMQVDTAKPKRTRKKRASEEMDQSEDEYVPRKTRSRQVKVEEVVPAVAKIQAMTEQMREKAAQ